MNDSPWMTPREASVYTRSAYETIRRACVRYQRTNGAEGLKNSQGGPKTRILIHVKDADRWIRRLPPLPIEAEAS